MLINVWTRELSWYNVKQLIFQTMCIEKYNGIQINKIGKFHRKWLSLLKSPVSGYVSYTVFVLIMVKLKFRICNVYC